MADDNRFVVVEFLKSLGNTIKGVRCEQRCLRKVAEVEERMNGDEEVSRDTTSNDADDIVLDGTVITAGNLLQFGQSFIERLEANRSLNH